MCSARGWVMVTVVGAGRVLRTVCLQHGPPTTAIRNVTVVDVVGGVLRPNQTVLVKGNRLEAIGPAHGVTVSDPAQVVEGTGKFLIPGLWDMHVHSVANVASDRVV